VTCLLDFKFINEKSRRLIILNVSSHCFTRSFVGSRNKVVIKTVHYHAKINATFFHLWFVIAVPILDSLCEPMDNVPYNKFRLNHIAVFSITIIVIIVIIIIIIIIASTQKVAILGT